MPTAVRIPTALRTPSAQQWLGDEVAEGMAGLGYYVKGSQVDYRARKWGLRKRLSVNTAVLGHPTDQDSHGVISEQRDTDDSATSHQTNTTLDTVDPAQLGSAWAVGESDTSGSGHVHLAALSSPSTGATQHSEHNTAVVATTSSWTSQHDQGSFDVVGSDWTMTQDMPRSDQFQDLYDPAASAHGDTSGLFVPTVNQVGNCDFSHNNNGFTELGIDPVFTIVRSNQLL